MRTDSLSRRIRFAPPNPKVARIVLTEADHLLFEAIARHGPLPTHYLYELTKHVRVNYANLQYRLTQMYNGDSGRPYLTRPPAQFNSFEARYQHVVYDLAPRARQLLQERGRLPKNPPNKTNWFVHDLMGACAAASIELGAKEKGLRYIGREEVLTHPRCGEAKDATSPMAIPLAKSMARSVLIPDDLFGLQYADGTYRRFAVEIDRNTESIKGKLGEKIDGYSDVYRRQAYKKWWGISSLHTLILTTNRVHGENILDYVKAKKEPEIATRFLVAIAPTFTSDEHWTMPKSLLTHLLDEPWQTVGAPKDISVP